MGACLVVERRHLRHHDRVFGQCPVHQLDLILGDPGYFAFDAIARPVLAFYGKLAAFEALRACAGPDTTLAAA